VKRGFASLKLTKVGGRDY